MNLLKSQVTLSVCLSFFFTGLVERLAEAQSAADNTLLTVEIMLPRITGDPVEAQRWGKVFEKLGESVRVRQPLPGDKPHLKETNRGPIRILKVVGELDRKSVLHFPDHSFTKNDTEQIKAWLKELKVYGAQGSPDGKQFWGLNQTQFEAVVKGVSKPIEFDTVGKSIKEVLDSLPIEPLLPVVIHTESKEAFFQLESTPVTQQFQGLSAGTSLTVLLRSHGYGFRPLRTPAGKIELTIEKLDSISEAWPVGWDIDQSRPRNQIVPNLYKFIKTGFQEAPLSQVLSAISQQTKTPILIDERLCEQKEIDVDTVGVSYPEKQTAWSLVLGSVVRQARLTDKIRLDEAGTPFVWVAPFVPYTPARK